MTPVLSLLQRWRDDAIVLRARGAGREADGLEQVARELEAALAEEASEALTLEQAAQESGLTYSALEQGVRAGRIGNAGDKGAPRIRRVDLPRKAQGPHGPELVDRPLAPMRHR